MKHIKNITSHHLFLPLFTLGFLLIFNGIFVDNFFKLQFLNGQLFGRPVDILNRSSILIVLSLGMTFVVATAGIDISQGSVMAISGAVATFLIGGSIDGVSRYPLPVAILAALVVCAFIGMLNGLMISKLNIQPRIATLIFLTAGRGIAMLVTKGQNITVYNKAFSYIGSTIPGSILPTTLFIALFMIVLVVLIIKKTSLGLFIQSVGINKEASKYTGIKVASIIFMVYVFSSICAGIAGIMEASLISASDPNNAGMNMEMDAILAVSLGGTLLQGGRFFIGGSVIGAITIQTLTTTLYALGISSEQLPVFKAIIVIIICLFQSEKFRLMFKNRKVLKFKKKQQASEVQSYV